METDDQLQDGLWLQNLQVELGGTFTWAYDEFEDSFSINGARYTIKSLLGEGSFGAVYHCTCETVEGAGNAQDVAVKIISTDRISIITGSKKQSVIRRMLHEAELLGCLGGHPHIVQLHCAAISQTSFRIFMVMQLLGCCDLFSELLRRRKAFPEDETREIVRQLSMAVSHCHRRRIAHRDIKLENIMLSSRQPPVLKLIDFGQAQIQGVIGDLSQNQGMNMGAASFKSAQTAKTLTSSSLYTPPDVKQAIEENVGYDAFKLDTFGIGVICYGLLCSSLPEAAKGGDFQQGPKWKALSVNAQDLISKLLCSDAHDRLSVVDILQHPFVTTDSSASLSPKVGTPSCDFEHERQALMASLALLKALQKERGASCWMLDGSQDAEMSCRWMCAATNDQFQEAMDAVQNLPYENRTELEKTLRKIRTDIEAIRTVCRQCDKQDGHPAFDTVFARYCKIVEDFIHLIGRLIVTISKHDAPLTVAELRIRLLLIVSEQLGRERGFICGHLRRRDHLMSWPVQRRFAKIQGCRQQLVGSTSSESAESGVVSFETGLLPHLRLSDAPLISRADLKALEDAESAVLGWKSTASEWFTIITGLIDKVYQQASVAFLELIRETGHSTSASHSLFPSRPSSGDHSIPQSQKEAMPPSKSATQSENSLSDRATSTPAGGSSPVNGHDSTLLNGHGGHPGFQQQQQQRQQQQKTSEGNVAQKTSGLHGFARSNSATKGSSPALEHNGTLIDGHRGYAASQQQQKTSQGSATPMGAGFPQQKIAEFCRFAGSSSMSEGPFPARGHDGSLLDGHRSYAGFQQQNMAPVGASFQQQRTSDVHGFAGSASKQDGSLPLRGHDGTLLDGRRGYAESQQQHTSNIMAPTGTGFQQQETFAFQRSAGSSAGQEIMYRGSLPLKVIPSRPPTLDTPEPTPLHPGLWQVWGQNFPPPPVSLLHQHEEMPLLEGHQSDGMLLQQGSGHVKRGAVGETYAPQTPSPSIPVPPIPVPHPVPRQQDPVMSKGTIGHPVSCAGLGCKFSSKPRGCWERENCLRCHLCPWKRGPEKQLQ